MTTLQERAKFQDPFLNDDDIHLDLNACPSLREPTKNDGDPFSPDPRFAPLATEARSIRKELEKLLSSNDKEILGIREAMGLGPQDTERTVYVRVGTDSVEVQVSLNQKTQKWEAEVEIDGDVRLMTDSVYDRLLGRLAVALNENAIHIRELSEQELLAVETLCQQNMIEAALMKALQWSCGPKADLSDPRYTPGVNYVVLTVWNYTRHFAPQTQDWIDFLPTYVGNRRYTIPLLDSAYYEFKRESEKQFRNSLFNSEAVTPEPTPQELDNLSDNEIHALYKETVRDIAKQYRRTR